MKFLLDTNVVLYLLGGRLADPLPRGEQFLSIISEMELLSYPDISKAEEAVVRNAIKCLTISGISSDVTEAAIELRKKYRLKLPDAIIAATAQVNGYCLLTNDLQFHKVKEIRCRAVSISPR